MTAATVTDRGIRAVLLAPFAPPDGQGLLSSDTRVRTLRKVIVTYPEVRHVTPARISLDGDTPDKTLDTVARFLERQTWLVTAVVVE